MKIAVANLNNQVEHHFGKCHDYLIFEIKGKEITSKEHLLLDTNGGCKSNVFNDLRSIGVSVFLVGNIGKGAYNKFKLNGIEVLPGFEGDSEKAVINFLQGNLPLETGICESHNHHHHFN